MLNTKDIKTGGGTPKVLQPGNQLIKIHKVELEDFKFKPGGLHIIIHAEGKDQGEGFEGFHIDKNDQSQGRYKGQVGRVKAAEYAYADGVTKSGIEVKRDTDMLRIMKNLCVELGCLDWLEGQDGKHKTIESLFAAFNKDKPFKDQWLNVCLAGKEYLNKEGYMNYDLFFPKFAKVGYPFEMAGKDPSHVIKFNETEHIRKAKPAENVQSFEGGGSDIVKGDFKL